MIGTGKAYGKGTRPGCFYGCVNSNYRIVLRVPGSTRLITTSLLARLPQGMTALAILLLVHGASGSYAAAGVAVGATALATALSMPLQGRLVDRLGIRRVIAPAAVGQASAYVLLGVLGSGHPGAVPLIGCALLVGGLQPPISPVLRAALGSMFTDISVRESAFALEAVVQEIIWVSGPLVITVLITLGSPDASVYVLGGLGLAGALAFLRSPTLPDGRRPRDSEHEHRSALRSVDVRWLLVPVALMGIGLGSLDVGIPSNALHLGSRAASGVLLATWSFGSMVGGLWYGSRRPRSSVGTRYVRLMSANAAFIVPYLFAGSIPVSGVCSLTAGLAIAPVFSCQNALSGRVILPGTEHEAFSWILAALIAGAAAGSALSGMAIGAIGAHGPFVLACSAATLGALSSLRFRGRFPYPTAEREAVANEELAAV